MPTTNRLQDTLDYLRSANQSGLNVSDAEIEALVFATNARDRISGGAILSLNWSWYNSRPATEVRQAIRAFILISIYNGDISAAQAAAEAERIKNFSASKINGDISTRLKNFVAAEQNRALRAVTYTLAAAGGGEHRAKAHGIISDTTVALEMGKFERGQLAVMLIDMQTPGSVDSGVSVTGNRFFEGQGHIAHMAEVLEVARHLDLITYEIVIDKAAAHNGGVRGTIKTIPTLKRKLEQIRQCNFLPKPFYNSFQDTPLAEWLLRDGIKALVVMGYDANLCVKNTIFGTPQALETIGGRARTASEIVDWRKATPNQQAYTDRMIPQIEEKQLCPYLPGLLDRGFKVLTSRAIAASGTSVLEDDYGPISRM